MLIPRKVKHRKMQKMPQKGISQRGYKLSFGQFGLKAKTGGRISSRQIEAARRAATRSIKKSGQIWIRIFPDLPVTSRPPETGMGGGKGSLDHFVAQVLPGRVILEMDGITEEVAKEALRLAGAKLPVKTKFIKKE